MCIRWESLFCLCTDVTRTLYGMPVCWKLPKNKLEDDMTALHLGIPPSFIPSYAAWHNDKKFRILRKKQIKIEQTQRVTVALVSLWWLTSSIPAMLFTASFFREPCSFLSSAVAVLWTTFFFLRAVPWRGKNGFHNRVNQNVKHS